MSALVRRFAASSVARAIAPTASIARNVVFRAMSSGSPSTGELVSVLQDEIDYEVI